VAIGSLLSVVYPYPNARCGAIDVRQAGGRPGTCLICSKAAPTPAWDEFHKMPFAWEKAMHASQVMTRSVVTVPADATVYAAADILLGSRISAAPVVDADGRMVGVVSEADLMNRPETGTVPSKSWLERLLADDALLARDYIRSHSHHVADVMTKNVITAQERTPLKDIAALMQRHHIKRVPILRDGKVVGIVSRANLLQGLLAREPYPVAAELDDDSVREAVAKELARHSWGSGVSNIVVDNGTVSVWGYVYAASAKEAVRIAVENVAGVRRVVNNVVVMPREVYSGV
jgi:CBS domain-containing protein